MDSTWTPVWLFMWLSLLSYGGALVALYMLGKHIGLTNRDDKSNTNVIISGHRGRTRRSSSGGSSSSEKKTKKKKRKGGGGGSLRTIKIAAAVPPPPDSVHVAR